MTKSLFGSNYREVEVGEIAFIAKEKPLVLECGVNVYNIPIAYQTYGKLNADKSNVILVCHALTGDQYVCGTHPVTGKTGW